LRGQNVGLEERGWIEHGAAVVALRREVHDRVDPALGEQVLHQVYIADIAVDKGVAILVALRHISEIGEIADICEEIDIKHTIIRVAIQPIAHEIRPDKTSATCNQEVHALSFFAKAAQLILS